MKLDEGQRKQIAAWIDEGLKLSDLQNKIGSEMGLSMTYMELRFTLDDAGLKLKEIIPPPAAPPAPIQATGPASPATASPLGEEEEELGDFPADENFGGGVSVSVAKLTRPGTMISGQVTFSDKKTAEWYLDQTGRLGLVSKEPGYKPSQEDILEFQAQLHSQMAKLGL